MTLNRKWFRLTMALMTCGALLPGCLAAVQGALDLVLSPGAIGNAVLLPASGLAGIALLAAQALP